MPNRAAAERGRGGKPDGAPERRQRVALEGVERDVQAQRRGDRRAGVKSPQTCACVGVARRRPWWRRNAPRDGRRRRAGGCRGPRRSIPDRPGRAVPRARVTRRRALRQSSASNIEFAGTAGYGAERLREAGMADREQHPRVHRVERVMQRFRRHRRGASPATAGRGGGVPNGGTEGGHVRILGARGMNVRDLRWQRCVASMSATGREPMMRKWILLLALACQGTAHAAVPETPRFRLLGVAEGMPSSSVNALARDRDGYLWVATIDGLARYDGVGFRVWRHVPGDPSRVAWQHRAGLAHRCRGPDLGGDRIRRAQRARPDAQAASAITARPRIRRSAATTPGRSPVAVATLWFGTGGGGLHRLDSDGKITRWTSRRPVACPRTRCSLGVRRRGRVVGRHRRRPRALGRRADHAGCVARRCRRAADLFADPRRQRGVGRHRRRRVPASPRRTLGAAGLVADVRAAERVDQHRPRSRWRVMDRQPTRLVAGAAGRGADPGGHGRARHRQGGAVAAAAGGRRDVDAGGGRGPWFPAVGLAPRGAVLARCATGCRRSCIPRWRLRAAAACGLAAVAVRSSGSMPMA